MKAELAETVESWTAMFLVATACLVVLKLTWWVTS